MKLSYIYEQIINEDFKSQTMRYIKQGIEADIVKGYIDKFKHIRDKKYKEMFDTDLNISVEPNKRNDIDSYIDFHDLEQLVDYVGSKRPVGSSMSGKEDIEVSGEAIYKDKNFEVYYADTPRACIKYKGKFPYSWCIARSDSSNMFYTYRFKPYEPAFYFVKDLKATEKEFSVWNMGKNIFKGAFNNKYHFFVIQVPKNINPEDDNADQYIVSSANNDGDKQMSWNDILKINPNLKPIKNVLKPKPFTPEEKEKNQRFKNGIDDREFAKLSYEDKRSYLDIYPTIARPITTKQLMALPDDLLNLYVSFGIGLNDEQFEFIKPKKDIIKRYTQISKRKFEEYMKRDSYERRQLKMAYTELVILEDSDIKMYLESLSSKDINKFIKEYGADKMDLLEKHLSKFGTKYKSIKNLILNARANDEAAVNELHNMIPDGVGISFYGDKILIDLGEYADDIPSKLDYDTVNFYEYLSYNSWGGYDNYYDGDYDRLEEDYDGYLEQIIKTKTHLSHDAKAIGLGWDLETLKDLLETYDKKQKIEQKISDEFSEAKDNAEEKAFDEFKNDVKEIIFYDDDTVEVNLGAFIMYISNMSISDDETLSSDGKFVTNSKTGERYPSTSKFLTNDGSVFTDNIVTMLDTILTEYDVVDNSDNLWEYINEAGYNNMNVDNDSIISFIESEIEDALIEATSETNDDDYSEPTGDNVYKLKTQIIQTLNNTLKGLGQDQFATSIENDLVKIDIDRQRFHLDGKVHIKLTDKKTNKFHDGYVFIKDIPSYFTNYKLFEQLSRMNSLIRY